MSTCFGFLSAATFNASRRGAVFAPLFLFLLSL